MPCRRFLLPVLCLALVRPAAAQLADAKVLTAAAVKNALAAAEAEARRNGWNVSIAVVDAAGELQGFLRLDGAALTTIEIAQRKALTAARFRRPTKALADRVAQGGTALTSVTGTLALQGGVPIVVDGVVIGGVGVSGVTSEQDELVALAAVAAIKP